MFGSLLVGLFSAIIEDLIKRMLVKGEEDVVPIGGVILFASASSGFVISAIVAGIAAALWGIDLPYGSFVMYFIVAAGSAFIAFLLRKGC